MSRYYPVSLDLRGRACLVIGAGRVAERKIRSLLEAGAQVQVVAREAVDAVTRLAESGAIALRIGEVEDRDLDGVWLVIAATNDETLNRWVARECERRGVFANVVDVPALCSFIVPARIDRGPISVAVSSGAVAPAFAKWLRDDLESAVREEHGAFAELLGEMRAELRATFPEQRDRAAAWHRALESRGLELLRQGRADDARAAVRAALGLAP